MRATNSQETYTRKDYPISSTETRQDGFTRRLSGPTPHHLIRWRGHTPESSSHKLPSPSHIGTPKCPQVPGRKVTFPLGPAAPSRTWKIKWGVTPCSWCSSKSSSRAQGTQELANRYENPYLGGKTSLVCWPAAGVDNGAACGVQGPRHFWVSLGREDDKQ